MRPAGVADHLAQCRHYNKKYDTGVLYGVLIYVSVSVSIVPIIFLQSTAEQVRALYNTTLLMVVDVQYHRNRNITSARALAAGVSWCPIFRNYNRFRIQGLQYG